MIIDKLGNTTFTKSQLTKRAQSEINKKWNKDSEANLQRKLQGLSLGLYTLSAEEQLELDQYKADLERIKAETEQAAIDNQLLIDCIKYEKAIARLDRYILSAGKPSQPIYDLSPSFDENGIEYFEKIGDTKTIDPLPLTVEIDQYNEAGDVVGTTTVDNPLIVTDLSERSDAQAIIDNAVQTVIDLYAQRNTAK